MIGFLIISHINFGEGLISCVTHVLGQRPPQLATLAIGPNDDPTDLLPAAREVVKLLDTGKGVVIFTDIYGASPCNLACKLMDPGKVEVVTGVNLPMLVRALTYRNRDLETVIKKAVSGGCDGVLHVELDPIYAKARG
jgi:PTS system ascorbate-specific IIA component